jgi:dipeptidyl aminopeptidase/acylaminoacyl peptidase
MTDDDPLPLDAYYDFTQVDAVAVSPDGDRVAVTATEYDPDEEAAVASLFVVPADGSREPHRLTRVPDAGSPTWSPGGDRLAFLASREADTSRRVGRPDDEGEGESHEGAAEDEEEGEDENGDGEPEQQVWLFDLERGGDARQVTDRERGVRGFDWAPDGERLVVAARDPTEEEAAYLDEREEGGPVEVERLQHKVDGAGWRDEVTTYLFVVDVETGATERLDDAYGGGAFEPLYGLQPAWGRGGEVAFLSCRTENPDDTMAIDVYLVDPDADDPTAERATDADLTCRAPEWDDGGDRLAFVGSDPEDFYEPAEVYVRDGDGYRSVTPALDRPVWGTPRWASDGSLLALAGDEGRTRVVRCDVDGAEAERVFEAQSPTASAGGFDLAGGRIALVLDRPGDGRDVYAMDAGDVDAAAESPATRLTEANADLAETYRMPVCRRVAFESDGHEVEGWLYHPPDAEASDSDSDPGPLVLAVHGGPMAYHDPSFDFTTAAFVSRGYRVLYVNYRGSTSYGYDFAETLAGEWGTAEVADLVAGVEHAVDEGWADPERVFGHGFSYGGIAQGYLVTQTDVLTAAAPEHGIYDLSAEFGTSDSHNWLEAEFGLPWEDPEVYEAASSLGDVGNLETPLLVMAGGNDWRCPPSQSEQLYVSAKKQGVDARLVVYPDEHHAIGDPDRAIHRLEQLLEWYARHDPAESQG